ncbi:hypothetical protein DUNSADRAFT_3943 [Dunaliella salina]|uniref:Secreted protein n=1 Tax=Dunaliella salina TaxID=3046 RepID=A0ABQ7H7T7_DUNSA|nr:hypothetical protein DUNSADRAFT_3943 [Dunaliella salina]|eukprot:KAF5842916.1 hypothetical protein DUNSADRAFT_3943 [Dunaliella salina]
MIVCVCVCVCVCVWPVNRPSNELPALPLCFGMCWSKPMLKGRLPILRKPQGLAHSRCSRRKQSWQPNEVNLGVPNLRVSGDDGRMIPQWRCSVLEETWARTSPKFATLTDKTRMV